MEGKTQGHVEQKCDRQVHVAPVIEEMRNHLLNGSKVIRDIRAETQRAFHPRKAPWS